MAADERQKLRDRIMLRMLESAEFDPEQVGHTEAERYEARRMAQDLVISGDAKPYFYKSGTRYRWIN